MKIVNCTWEEPNLGKKTCEVTVSSDECESVLDQLRMLEQNFEYIVCKVPDCSTSLYKELGQQGFYFVENQINITYRQTTSPRMGKLAKRYLEKIVLKPVQDKDGMELILSKIGEDLFYTDRIALDPSFGIFQSNKRYSNWIRNTYGTPEYDLFEICLNEKAIGFSYFKTNGDTTDYLLAGLYPEYQSSGFGVMIPLASISFIARIGIKHVETSISSNNINVVRCYMECGFDIQKMTYVFAKVK